MNLFKKLSIGFILMFLFLFATNHLVSIAKADNVTVTSTPLVDLTADAPTQTLASTLTPIEFTTNIHNSGTVATGVGFDDSWNISTTADISNKITTLTTNYPISLPAGGQTYVVPGTTSPAYTFASAGTYYVQACADSGNVIAETNENNNCSTWTAISVSASPLADLTADKPTQTLATTLTPIEFDTNIHNLGTISTGEGFYNSWDISTTADISNKITTLTTYYPIPLAAAGQTYVVPSTTSPAYTFSVPGTYYVRACADSTNIVAETNENNNCSGWATISVSGILVDLTADAPTQTLASTLTPIEFTTNIHNSGTVATGVGFDDSWNISTTADISNKITTLTTNYPISLPAGGQTYVVPGTTSPAYTFASAGTYYVQACADSGNVIAETNENNNCSTWTAISVSASPLADLTADKPTQTLATTLTPIEFDTNIHNLGTISTGEGFYNSWDISTTADISNKITTLTTYYPIPLAAAGQTYVVPSTTSPAYTFSVPGTYYVRACADSTNIVAETNENNNCSGWVGIVATPVNTCANGATDYPTCTPPVNTCTNGATDYPTCTPPVNTCANGATDYPTCTPPPSTTSGTISATDCTIASGSSTCSTTLNWSTVNPVGTSAVTTPTNITVANGNSGSNKTYSMSFGSRNFYLYNSAVFLGQATATAACASGTSWNGTQCSTSTTLCTVATDTNYNTGPCSGTCKNGASDYQTCTPVVICAVTTDTNYNTAPCSGICKNGATDYQTCTSPVDPSTTVGSITASGCTISSGSSTCKTTLKWSTTNPVGTSAVTTPTNITVANGNSSTGKTYSISFGTKYFYLYNNSAELDSATATAACASGTSWNGTQCSTSTTLCTVATDTNYNTGPCSGTCLNGSNDYPICKITTVTTSGNLSVTDCKIASGASSCDTTITWSIVNPIPSKTTAITTPNSITVPGTSSTSGTATYPVSTGPGTRDFYLYHNGVQLGSTRTAHSSCIQGTDWDTTSGTCKDLPPGSGGWSDWSSIPDVCPLASGVQTRNCNYPAPSNGGLECLTESGTRALVETKAYPAVTSDQCPSIKDVVITPSNGGAAIDTTDSGSTIVTAKQVPYNAKLNIDWTSSNIQINECTCVYKDSTHKSGKDCPNFDGTSSYALPSLKKDTTFTISCAGSFSGNVSQDIKIKVAPINATYIEN